MAIEFGAPVLSTLNGLTSIPDPAPVGGSDFQVVMTAAEGSWARVRLVGELDLATAAEVAEVLSAAIVCGHVWVEIDASRLRFCDSTGLRCLLEARTRCAAAGGDLRLLDPHDRLCRLLQITGLETLVSATAWPSRR
jgi:anti-sigma B factor antagonist